MARDPYRSEPATFTATVTKMRQLEFDTYIAVDFSANKAPKSGKDSVWWSRASWSCGQLIVSEPRNPRTRDVALAEIREELVGAVARGESVLIGFDFPYGYPAGFAAAAGLATPAWRATWDYMSAQIRDRQDERWNNRFEVAAGINTHLGSAGPFWGCPSSVQEPGLLPTKPPPASKLREFRHTEAAARGAKATWQLFYNGSVGSQTLLGLPRLAALRSDPKLAGVSLVWPFETGAALPPRHPSEARIIHAEIYPSLVDVRPEPGVVKDALQVEAQTRFLAEQDHDGALRQLFEAPARRSEEVLNDVASEEGWILGVT